MGRNGFGGCGGRGKAVFRRRSMPNAQRAREMRARVALPQPSSPVTGGKKYGGVDGETAGWGAAPEQRGSADKKANGRVRSVPRVVNEMRLASPQPSAMEFWKKNEEHRETNERVKDGKTGVGKREGEGRMMGTRQSIENGVRWALPQPSPMKILRKDGEQRRTDGVVADGRTGVGERKSAARMTGSRQTKEDESGQVREGMAARGPRGLDPPTIAMCW